MTSFFDKVTTLDELKKEYRRLALELHPDCGGSNAAFVDLQNQYAAAMARIKSGAAPESKDATSEEVPAEFIEVVNLIISLNLSAELCGSWLWVSGDTYSIKDKLKAAGFKWAGKKRMWYWHPADEAPSKSRHTLSMDEIRKRHGSTRVNAGTAGAWQRQTLRA